jgi:hypothetical protein
MMKDTMIMTAVEETGLPAENRDEILTSVQQRDYAKAKNLLHEGRDSLLAEIHQKEDEIRHIDWIIYTLGRAES